MALLNVGECSGVIMQAARMRWPESRGFSGPIRPSFLRRLEQRVIYAIAEEVARTRKDGLIARS